MISNRDSARWYDICGPKREFDDHHTDRRKDYAFEGNVLRLPNGDSLIRTLVDGYYRLRGPKGGVRSSVVELWVHGMQARDEEQFLSFLNGDAHDQSKCQVRTPYEPPCRCMRNHTRQMKIWSVS